jgi:hypothetical protein
MQVIRRRMAVVLSLVFVLAFSAACGRNSEEEPAVARASLTLDHERIPIGSPVTLNYRFEVMEGASIDDDYWVFVHVLDPDGERLWHDDHMPPRPTSTWQSGEVIEYSRQIFVPTYPYIGEATVRLGLYKDDRRLPLEGNEIWRREYEVARVTILPQSETIFRIYKDGWHNTEVSADDPTVAWQWTTRAGSVSFRNPKKDVLLYLDAQGRPDLLPAPQEVTLRIGDRVIGTFPADTTDRQLMTYPVTAEQLGSEEMVELVIEVDRTIPPRAGDPRELGLRVFNLFVDPR